MTITSQPLVKTYDCAPTVTSFVFPYRFLDPSDLLVHHMLEDGSARRLTLGGDYTVAGAGAKAGGTVTLTPALADGRLRVFLGIATAQLNTYADNNAFPAQSHEDALDRLTLLTAMRQEEFTRAYRVAVGDGRAQQVPPVAARGGKLWAWDSQGDLLPVPTVKGDDTLAIDAASIFWDYNGDAHPRLVIDPSGAGSAIGAGIPNPGGADHAVLMLQDSVPILDHGQSRVWMAFNFTGWTEGAGDEPSDKHSRFGVTIQARSEVSAATLESPDRYLPQEVGALSLGCAAAAGTDRAKVETLVVSAREEEGLAGPSKGVAIQAITVRTTQGPDPDDRSQLSSEDSDDGADDLPGSRVGSFTLRLNGGTVGGALGGYRSWAAMLASGRAGYFNGVALGKVHKFDTGGPTDPDGVAGWGGVWGGRSFWHQGTFAVYAKDACPGWLTVGHDGIPDSGASAAIAPVDIQVDTVAVPSAWAGHVLAYNGHRLLGAPATGWTVPADGDMADLKRDGFDPATVALADLARVVKALVKDLGHHGLIAAG